MIRFQSIKSVLILPNPKLGDQREHVLGVTRHFAMAGNQITFNDPTTSVKLTLNFNALSRIKTLEARAFFIACSGQQIKYLDQDGRTWTGLVTNSPGFTSRGICNDAIVVEFEGN